MNRPSSSSLPFPVRDLSAAEVLRSETWLAHPFFLSARLPLGGLSACLHVPEATLIPTGLHRRATSTDPGLKETICLAVGLGDAAGSPPIRGVLVFEKRLARKLVDRALGRAHARDRRELNTGELGALLWIVEQAGCDWIDAGGGAFSIEGILADETQIAELLGTTNPPRLTAELHADEIRGSVSLSLANSGSLALPLALPAAQRSDIPSAALHWNTTLSVIAGEGTLNASDLADADVGDVIVLDTPLGRAQTPGRVHLVYGGCRIAARVDGARCLELDTTIGENNMTTPKEMELTEPRTPHPGNLQVTVQAELGQLNMSVEQATALRPGQVLQFQREIGPEVWLRVGEQLVAKGEIVNYDGMMAVEVTERYLQSDS